MQRLRPPVQSASTRARFALEHARTERLVPDAALEHEVQTIAQVGPIRPRQHAAVAQRARTVLHAPLKPHHDPPVASSSATRDGRPSTGSAAKPARSKRRGDRAIGDSRVRGRDRVEIEVDRLAGRRRRRHRRAQRQPAVAHVRETRRRPRPRAAARMRRVGPDVRHDAAGQRERDRARSGERRRGQARRTRLLHDALRQVRELLVRDSASGSARAPGRSACPGASVSMTPSRTLNPRQQRVVLIGNRRGVVGQRHHLALVFELAHVEEVRDVLEEHAERACAPATRPRARAGRRERPEIVDDRPSPTPSIVSTAHGAKPAAHAAAAACAS